MNPNRKLVGCSLIAALVLSLLPAPSLGTKSQPLPAKAQDQPVMKGQLVQNKRRDQELSKHFRKYDLIKMDAASAAAQVRNKGRLVLQSSVREFDMELTPHDMRSANYSAQVIDSNGVIHPLPKMQVNTYKGEVKDLPGAQARVSLTARGLEGAIFTKQGRYFIQPAQSISKQAQPDEFVLYETSDVEKTEGTCGVTLADEVAARQEAALDGAVLVPEAKADGPVSSITPMKIARISTDADGEYVAGFGGASGAITQINNILNFVDGVYQSEIGLTFQIVQQNTWADASTDPYISTAPSTRLQQFRDHWNANFPNSGANTRSLAHLFTGVDLDGSTIGIASLQVVCRNANFSYGLSQWFPLGQPVITAQTVVLTAHEIGHNFSASHTNQATSDTPQDVETACDQTIMESSVGPGVSFCPFSRSQIAGQVNAFPSCLLDTVTSPPTSQDCTPMHVGLGISIPNTLGPGDCRSPSRGVEFFADRYTFNGTAGQRIAITMSQDSASLDPYLYLIGPDGYVLAQDNNGNGGASARIPRLPVSSESAAFTLPQTGLYTIEATSFNRLQSGSYQFTLSANGCTISTAATNTNFPASGGSGTVYVTLTNCASDPSYSFLAAPNTASWLVPETTAPSGTRAVNFTVEANSSSAGRRAFILVGANTIGTGPNDIGGGIRIPITQSGSAPDCSVTPISFGQTINADLASGDCHSPVRGANFLADRYVFNAVAGQKVAILGSGTFDAFLTLLGPNGVVLLTDDDGGGGTNARIPGGNRSLSLGLTGTYTIEVTSLGSAGSGSYSVTLNTDNPVADSVQFSDSIYNVAEDAGFLIVTVSRFGNTLVPATVNFATSDTAGLTNCTVANGLASERCDYATTVGTLRFAAGEINKIVVIPIVGDVLVEGNETFAITLSGATGTSLGSPQAATVRIFENDTATSGTNPIDNIPFFVTQQYIDFLGRLPDAVGFQNWVNTLNGCPNGGFGENDNPGCDRVHVSAGFYLSVEFQGRGYFAYRFYEVALDRRPTYAEFVPDMAIVGGAQSPESEVLSKAAYTQAWPQRPEFKARYDALSNAEYVNALEANAEVTLSNKQALIDALNGGTTNRGQVLRDIVETQAVADRFFNRAFVSMQYFGYLRRDPDTVGFQNWLNTLNADPSNFRHMIFGFLFSTEYRQRFGP